MKTKATVQRSQAPANTVRAAGDRTLLDGMFARIVDDNPAYRYP